MSTIEEPTPTPDITALSLKVAVRQYRPGQPTPSVKMLGEDALIMFEPEGHEIVDGHLTMIGRLALSDVPVDVAATLLRAAADVLEEGIADGTFSGDELSDEYDSAAGNE